MKREASASAGALHVAGVTANGEPVVCAPRTALGARLAKLRRKIVASGEALLTWDDIERELAESRGPSGERAE